VIHAPYALHRALQRSPIAQITFDRLDLQSIQYREITAGAHQHAHPLARSDKLPRNVATHESRGAGYQSSHKDRQIRSCRAIFSRQISQERLRATNIAAFENASKSIAPRKPQRRFTTSKARIA
jgi:hypothetical protein